MTSCFGKKTVFRALVSAVILAFLLGAAAQHTPQKLTNDDIIKMTRDGFEEGVIVALIEGNATAFDVSINGLTALKQACVTHFV